MRAQAMAPQKLKAWLHLGGREPEFHALLDAGRISPCRQEIALSAW